MTSQWIFLLLTVFTSSGGDLLCAQGMSSQGELPELGSGGLRKILRSILTQRLVILGWLCYAVSFFSLMGLLSVAALSVAVPATALSFVLDTLGARFFLHEHLPWKRWVGVVCVTAGVVMVVQPVPKTPVLARAAGTDRAAVQPCKDETRHHQSGTGNLHHKSAPCKVLAKP